MAHLQHRYNREWMLASLYSTRYAIFFVFVSSVDKMSWPLKIHFYEHLLPKDPPNGQIFTLLLALFEILGPNKFFPSRLMHMAWTDIWMQPSAAVHSVMMHDR